MLRLGCLGDLLRFEKREIEVAALAPDRSSPQSNGGDEAECTGSVGEGAGAPDSTLDLGVQDAEQRGAGTPAFLIPFPRYFSAAESDVLKRQVRQIVQS